MKKHEKFEHPKQCPNGHRQISWHSKEHDIQCWLCNKAYSISECLGPHVHKPKPSTETKRYSNQPTYSFLPQEQQSALAALLFFSFAFSLEMRRDLDMFRRQERRQYHRATVKLPVVIMTGNSLMDGEIQDLSMGGAFIHCLEMPNPSDNFSMVITAEGRFISVTAAVVWTGTQRSSSKNVLGGIGVRFKQIFINDQRFLKDVITKHYKKNINHVIFKKEKSSL